MATKFHNLSTYNPEEMPEKEFFAGKKFAIAVATWNENITFALLEGALDAFAENGVARENVDVVFVPGTFELTFAANRLQQENAYSAVIVIGCVVRGDTPHFDYVCQGVTQGVTALNAREEAWSCPVIFSVLTTDNMEQAKARAGGELGNKGVEGAITALKMCYNFCKTK